MAPAPPRPPVHQQPRLLVNMFSDPQPVLDHSIQRLLRRGGHDNNCAVITTLDES